MSGEKMAEEIVKERWPDAECWGPCSYCRFCKEGVEHEHVEYQILSEKAEAQLGTGNAESEAWSDAASRLEKR